MSFRILAISARIASISSGVTGSPASSSAGSSWLTASSALTLGALGLLSAAGFSCLFLGGLTFFSEAGRFCSCPPSFLRDTCTAAFFRPKPKIPAEPVEIIRILSSSLATLRAAQALSIASSTSVPLYSILADIVCFLHLRPFSVSDHRAPHLAAIDPAHGQKYASSFRLPQPAAPCDRLFRGYLTSWDIPRDPLPFSGSPADSLDNCSRGCPLRTP